MILKYFLNLHIINLGYSSLPWLCCTPTVYNHNKFYFHIFSFGGTSSKRFHSYFFVPILYLIKVSVSLVVKSFIAHVTDLLARFQLINLYQIIIKMKILIFPHSVKRGSLFMKRLNMIAIVCG